VRAAEDFVMGMFSQVHEDSRRGNGHVSLFMKYAVPARSTAVYRTTWAIDTTSMDTLFGAALSQLMMPNQTPFS